MSTTPPDLEQLAADYRHAKTQLEQARTALRAGVRDAAAAGATTKEIQALTDWSRAQIKAVKAA